MKRLRERAVVADSAVIQDVSFGIFCEVCERSMITESTLGDFSYVMNDCEVIYCDMGKFCSVAAHVRINPGQHPTDRAAMHHFTYRSMMFDMGRDDTAFFAARRGEKVRLGHDVWIGHGAVIMPGVTIGTGAVVGAGSVVTRNVPDFTIVVGVPAKPLRQRFDRTTQEGLRAIAWWDWPTAVLKLALPDFRRLSAEAFVRKYRYMSESISGDRGSIESIMSELFSPDMTG